MQSTRKRMSCHTIVNRRDCLETHQNYIITHYLCCSTFMQSMVLHRHVCIVFWCEVTSELIEFNMND